MFAERLRIRRKKRGFSLGSEGLRGTVIAGNEGRFRLVGTTRKEKLERGKTMSWKLKLATVGIAAAASVLIAQETPTSRSTQEQETIQNVDGSTTTTTKTTTVTGDVVRYEPGKSIVIRDPNSRTTTYTIDENVVVPTDVQVGRKVTIYTVPGKGTVRVQRITTVTSTNPDGSSSQRTEVRDDPAAVSADQLRQPPSSAYPAQSDVNTTQTTKTTKIITVNGTVQAYEPGQTITVVGPDSKTTVYTISSDVVVPQDVVVGKQVTLQTTVVSGKPVVRSVTTRTTTVKTTKSQ
jgi:hypothetical protein